MSITVISQGLLTTIQDIGRYGYQKHGVVVSGAMDSYAMRLSNIIVGNNENEGVLEITFIGPALSIQKGNLIAITGGNMSPTINGKEVPLGRPVYLREDSVLKFGKALCGCRCYVSVAGGFDIPYVMESKSTYLRGKLGGKDGRALQKNDVLKLGEKSQLSLRLINKLKDTNKRESFVSARWYVKSFMTKNTDNAEIRVFEDRQFKEAAGESINEFFKASFRVDSKSDRMGYRLNGPKIEFEKKIEMVSEEVSFGTIQIPPDGNPIILLADRATAGGYPKLAHVVACDFGKLVQLKPSDKIKFKKITLNEAEKLYLEREKYLEELKKSIKLISL